MKKIKNEIEDVLLDLVKSINMYKIDNNNTIFDVNYKKYTNQLLLIFQQHCDQKKDSEEDPL